MYLVYGVIKQLFVGKVSLYRRTIGTDSRVVSEDYKDGITEQQRMKLVRQLLILPSFLLALVPLLSSPDSLYDASFA